MSSDQTFKVTKAWVKDNSSKNNAYTKAQLKVLSVNWPPIKGWIKEVIGRDISLADKRAFEVARTTVVPRTKKKYGYN